MTGVDPPGRAAEPSSPPTAPDSGPGPGMARDEPAALEPHDEAEAELAYPRAHPWRRRVAAVRWWLVLFEIAIALVAFGAGLVAGRASGTPPAAIAASTLERELLPLARTIDAIWTDESDGGRPVAVAVTDLRRSGDVTEVRANIADWLRTHDVALRKMARIEVRPVGRAVQRQFLAGVAVSRDALEVLAHAVEVDSEGARRVLVAESIRLRSRSESLSQAARTSLNRLADVGQGTEDQNTSVPPRLPSFDELVPPLAAAG